MKKENSKKKIGIGLMIGGLIFMLISYFATENVNLVLAGLGMVIVGNTIHFLGQKEAQKMGER